MAREGEMQDKSGQIAVYFCQCDPASSVDAAQPRVKIPRISNITPWPRRRAVPPDFYNLFRFSFYTAVVLVSATRKTRCAAFLLADG
ncbi:hypothetical protein LMH87_004875 [Akanthomyces muscarius]|uniref:Uncharacterized protein n=1 Tax=Akanthomyces muscarius TaxID=2231603 RepID=A0A9W8Q4L3_AKAMU|nr:hypothetical protein LMH87_004875 [Akanthomyces muscarius]KAJ4146045.1 hypothetical protein LMH87_004875 [Akanthomyces muscarius]